MYSGLQSMQSKLWAAPEIALWGSGKLIVFVERGAKNIHIVFAIIRFVSSDFMYLSKTNNWQALLLFINHIGLPLSAKGCLTEHLTQQCV